MSEHTLACVLRVLPGDAGYIRQALAMTHEDVYAALVILNDRGMLRMVTQWKNHTGRARVSWEAA